MFEGLDPASLSKEQKRNSLHAINLIKEKRNGKIKGRTVADGRKQRDIYICRDFRPADLVPFFSNFNSFFNFCFPRDSCVRDATSEMSNISDIS